MIILITSFVIFNYFLSLFIERILARTSKLVIDNYEILHIHVPENKYKIYLDIYNNPNAFEKIWVHHIPFYNLYQTFVFLMDLGYFTEKLVNKDF